MNNSSVTKRKKAVYRVDIIRKPYVLTEDERAQMKALFDTVMAPLAFYARPVFLERLFDTDILIRVTTKSGALVAFSNAVKREIDGRKVIHVISVYVDPAHRSRGLMKKMTLRLFLHQFIEQRTWFIKSLFITASTVNPQAALPFARRCEVWPDLFGGRAAPTWARCIAEESAAKFYPVQTGVPFQVQITADYAGLQAGVVQKTGDQRFDDRFFRYADAQALKLLFFVVRVRVLHLIRWSLTAD